MSPNSSKANTRRKAGFLPAFALLMLFSATLFFAFGASALPQSQQGQQAPPQKPDQTQPPPAEAGGPQGDIGPIAVPKKKPAEEKPPEKPAKVKNPEEIGQFSLHVDVPLVNLDVAVVTKDGQFIPGLKKDNFRVYEDGVLQNVSAFQQSERPITAVLLVEFAATNYYMINDMLNGAYSFAQALKKDDYIAVVSYDMKPQMLVDFTQDKRQVYSALGSLRIPGFSETNMFDALYDTLDRLEGIEGHKYVVLIASGYDSFSKLTLDKVLKKVQGVKDTTIYAIGTGQAIRERADAAGQLPAIQRLDYLQADNQMRTFAKMTGGQAYFPRFTGVFPEIFNQINADIRNQYTISYRPTNAKQDGSFRKLKIEVIAANGQPLKVMDQRNKEVKYHVISREGYRAKQEVE
jgi:VWFA-related protein